MPYAKRITGVAVAVVLVTGLAAGCGGSDSDLTSTGSGTTLGPGEVAADSGGTASTELAGETTDASACADDAGVPDGTWSGPIELRVDGTNTEATGSITSTGSGELDLVVEGGVVTGTSWSFEATTAGQIGKNGSSAAVTAAVSLTDGTLSGTADAISLAGTAELSGTMTVNASGVSIDAPLTASAPGTTDLVIVSVSCDEVVASFIPAWLDAADAVRPGDTQLFGSFTWTGHPA